MENLWESVCGEVHLWLLTYWRSSVSTYRNHACDKHARLIFLYNAKTHLEWGNWLKCKFSKNLPVRYFFANDLKKIEIFVCRILTWLLFDKVLQYFKVKLIFMNKWIQNKSLGRFDLTFGHVLIRWLVGHMPFSFIGARTKKRESLNSNFSRCTLRGRHFATSRKETVSSSSLRNSRQERKD